MSATAVFWFGLRPDPLLVARQIDAQNVKVRPKLSIASAFSTLAKFPVAGYSIISIALSHMTMVAVMSMTPVHVTSHGGSLVFVGFVISLHILGMYAFAPLFGILSDKIGPTTTILVGQVIFVAALLIAGLGSEEEHLVTIGLFLLGLGWSAATVAGSALLVVSVPAEQKTNVQGLSDSIQNLAGATGGAVAGSIVALSLFTGLNLASLVPVAIVMVLSFLVAKYKVKQSQVAKDLELPIPQE
jgi:MFS family permease